MWADQDELDLNLSPTFIEAIGRQPMREIFALDSDDNNMSSSSVSKQGHDNLDDCVNQSFQSKTLSIASLIQGSPI